MRVFWKGKRSGSTNQRLSLSSVLDAESTSKPAPGEQVSHHMYVGPTLATILVYTIIYIIIIICKINNCKTLSLHVLEN